MSTEKFTWIDFYMEFADKLLPYKNDRQSLIDKIKNVFESAGIDLPKLEKDNNIVDIDPFTIFAAFNRGYTITNKLKIIGAIANEFSINASVPIDLDGIPHADNRQTAFYRFIGDRGNNDIDNLWEMFENAINYSNNPTAENKALVSSSYNKVVSQYGVSWNLTMGLFWIRPYVFINLDATNKSYIESSYPDVAENKVKSSMKLPTADEYLDINDTIKENIKNGGYPFSSLPELSLCAFESVKKSPKKEDDWWPSLDYYNPNLSVEDWVKYLTEVEMKEHPSPMQMLKAMLELGGQASCKELSSKYGGKPTRYIGCAVSLGKRVKKFFNLPPCMDGDSESFFIYPFLGLHKSDEKNYTYRMRDELLEALKSLDLSKYNPYCNDDPQETSDSESITSSNCYTKENFLNEVYMSEADYETLRHLLKSKKNIILQGAPGVGKTFAAKRLAYSIIGYEDNDKVEFVQFHQNYSYEDFVEGYKPKGNTFELTKGIFYKFCIKALVKPNEDFFFIIDEINRGNLSKIFGELMMLIEKDYRKESATLAYSGVKFSVPENLHIIGMMNTADRSLAMIDYALRRRFSFFDMTPGFNSDGFKNYQKELDNEKFDSLINEVISLNKEIEDDESLGKGFMIGHSYFCGQKECTSEWMNEVVKFDIIPMLNEYWFDNKANVEKWSNNLLGVIK